MPKTSSSIRSVSFPDSLSEMLKDYHQLQKDYKESNNIIYGNDNWLFIQKNGCVMSMGSPYAKFHDLIDRYNKNNSINKPLPYISLHGLRHTNASLLIASGEVNIETVSRKLGHSSMTTTMRYYVHPYEETEKESANVMERILEKKR